MHLIKIAFNKFKHLLILLFLVNPNKFFILLDKKNDTLQQKNIFRIFFKMYRLRKYAHISTQKNINMSTCNLVLYVFIYTKSFPTSLLIIKNKKNFDYSKKKFSMIKYRKLKFARVFY